MTAVHNFGGGDILDMTLGGRKGVLIPFTQAAVPEVDLEGGSSASIRSRPDLSRTRMAMARPTRTSTQATAPRGPSDAGGNR